MILASGDPAMWIGMSAYGIGFIGAPLLARHKNLSPIMYAAGILGFLGLLAVAVVSARCKDCKEPISAEELKRKTCPRCRRDEQEPRRKSRDVRR